MNDHTGPLTPDRSRERTTPGAEVLRPGAGDLPERFTDPGLPEHLPRRADTDPRAARRAELQVVALLGVSILGTVLALVAFFGIQIGDDGSMGGSLGRLRLSTLLIGLGLFLSLFGIGVGAVHLAKTLMPDRERTEDRHPQRGDDETRAQAVRILGEGAEESGLRRRPLIRNTLLGALALAPLPGVVLLRDTGPLPGDDLSRTFWSPDLALVRDPEGGRIRPEDLVVGSVVHVMPEGIENSEHPLEERAKAAVLVIRPRPRRPLTGGRGRRRRRDRGLFQDLHPWGARWRCTSSRRTTCCARATSPPSRHPGLRRGLRPRQTTAPQLRRRDAEGT